MTRVRGVTGGGEAGKNVGSYRDAKREPIVNVVSPGAVSRLGGMVGPGTPHKALYNKVAYTTPVGPTSNLDARPGGNGRQIMPSGSQSSTPQPRPMKPGRPSF
jgi:hypothetical protein